MPNIGPFELIAVLVIALLLLGPSRLPNLANAVGRSLREFRRGASDVDAAVDDQAATPGAGSSGANG